MRHTDRFGTGLFDVSCTWTQLPVFAIPHALPALPQNAWHVPKRHVRPTAQPAVATHDEPIGAVPATTHSALPEESGTSHVCARVHPHWGKTPHLLLGAERTQVSGASGAASTPASLPVMTGFDCGVFGGAALCSGVSAGVDAAAGTSSVNGARALELEHAVNDVIATSADKDANDANDANDAKPEWLAGVETAGVDRVDRDGIDNAIF